MTVIGQPERATQNRVVAVFCDELGWRHLGDWSDRDGNSNIEESLLLPWLQQRGATPAQISAALLRLRSEAGNHHRTLYANNQAVYGLLRYGVPVKTEAGAPTQTVQLIDWAHPEANDFAIAEEVTLKGDRTRRPDLVLYVNGIAIGVIELKNSRVSVGDGIRQCLSNQLPMRGCPSRTAASVLDKRYRDGADSRARRPGRRAARGDLGGAPHPRRAHRALVGAAHDRSHERASLLRQPARSTRTGAPVHRVCARPADRLPRLCTE